jgi:glutaredoxin
MYKYLLLYSFLLLCTSSQAEIYQWHDANGKTHFSDTKPVNYKSQSLTLSPNIIAHTEQVSDANTAAAELTLYSTQWCGYCKKARQHFHAQGIPFIEKDIEKSPSAAAEHKKLGGGGIPVIVFKGQTMRGFRADRFDDFYAQLMRKN